MRMPRWLRRQLVPVIALAVLLPACAALVLGVPWSDYRPGGAGPIVAEPEESVSLGGAEWRLDQTAEFIGTGTEGNGIPLDSSIVAALVTVAPDGGADGPACVIELTQLPGRAHPEGRSWTALVAPADYRYGLGEDTSVFCDRELRGPYQLELVFLVPRDVYGDAFIDLTVGEQVLRLPMGP